MYKVDRLVIVATRGLWAIVLAVEYGGLHTKNAHICKLGY